MENKKRLIDANAFQFEPDPVDNIMNGVLFMGRATGKTLMQVKCCLKAMINNAPTVDAVEVVHARWNPIRNFGGGECYGYCTNCKTPVKADNATGLVMSNRFCHWCGAKMDGGNKDG